MSKNILIDSLNEMNTYTLHRTVSNLSCSQKNSVHDYISLNVFYLYLTSGELDCLTLNRSGKAHTSKYISEFPATQVTHYTKTLI